MRALVLLSAFGLACATPGSTSPKKQVAPSGSGPGSDDTGLPAGVEEPVYSGSFTAPSRHSLETLDLPPGPDGTGLTLLETSPGTLWLDLELRDPVTAAGACAALVIACISPDERNIHGCLIHGGTCATDTPWEEGPCCPAGCVDAYRSQRAAGREESEALIQAVYFDDQCIPGITDIASDAPAGGAR